MEDKNKGAIDTLRKRLYERGKPAIDPIKHELTKTHKKVKTVWDSAPDKTKHQEIKTSNTQTGSSEEMQVKTPDVMTTKKTKRKYRVKLLLAGVLFFVLSVAASSLFIIFGNNTISTDNITIAVTGPFTMGGGDVLPLQIGITNANAVSIESATLIVEYPRGTLSADDEKSSLHIEHFSLDTIKSGETINIPLRAVVFGEENDEKYIKVSIEYRVQGSNAIFFKDAEPFRFKISSSPVTITVESLRKVSSGQEINIEIVINSNSPTLLEEILVIAEYPLGFNFTSSTPSPTGSRNIWLLKDLEPKEAKTITITGVVVGKDTSEYVINFSVGIPNERNKETISSVFATAQTQFEIESPFISIDLKIDDVQDEEIVINPGDTVSSSIEIKNTLTDSVYDIVVEVQFEGNALSDVNLGSPEGFYDSLQNKIIWDVSTASELDVLHPGEKLRFTFNMISSKESLIAPTIVLDVNVRARRVSEREVTEVLLGTVSNVIKISSSPDLVTSIGFNSGAFQDSGPIPPKAEQTTTYSVSFMIKNGSNDISNAVVTAVLPTYVEWKNKTSGVGTLTFNEARRIVTWNPPPVDANAAIMTTFQIALTPSTSQIGEEPVLIGKQRLKANDKFTGDVVRDVNRSLDTEMLSEHGHARGNGRVIE